MAQIDNHPDPKTRQGRHHWQKTCAPSVYCAKRTKRWKKHLLPQILTHIAFHPAQHGLRPKKHDMHCTVYVYRRHCCRLFMKKAGSMNSARCAAFDSCIRQWGPSTTARVCLQHQHTGSNPSLDLQLYVELMSQSSFSTARI